LVIGSGPAGMPPRSGRPTLGLDVTLVDNGAAAGGVCLYKGCIPPNFLFLSELIFDAARAQTMGSPSPPPHRPAGLRRWESRGDRKDGGRPDKPGPAARRVQLVSARPSSSPPRACGCATPEIRRIASGTP